MRLLITLPRYILTDLVKTFLMSLAIYSFVFLALMCSEVARNDVSVLTIFRIIPYIFPMISRLVLPLSVITAILISYGRFAANNELLAAQASGIHPFWLGAPGVIIAFFASIISIYLNADMMTAAVVNMERRILADRTHIINAKLEKPGSFSFPIPGSITLAICRLPATWSGGDGKNNGIDFAVFHQPTPQTPDEIWDTHYPYLETRTLAKNHQIRVTDSDSDGMTIVGDFWDAIVFNKLSKNLTSIQLTPHTRDMFTHPSGGFEITFDPNRLQYMGLDRLQLVSDRYRQQIEDLARRQYDELSRILRAAGESSKRQLPEKINEWLAEDKPKTEITLPQIRERLPLLRSEWEKIKTDNDANASAALDNLTSQIQTTRQQLIGTHAEIQVKLVMSFACIAFAFLGIPLAMLGRCGSTAIGYVVGLAFAFVFYMVISALFNAVRSETFGWQVLWYPNALMLIASGYLWWRGTRMV